MWIEVPLVLVVQARTECVEVDVDWIERGLVKWQELLEVLDMCLSL